MRVAEYKSIGGCTQGSKVAKVWPTKCCCEHTHVYRRNHPGIEIVTELRRPTNCCCEHTHVCCRVRHLRVAPMDQVRPTNCCCELAHVRCKNKSNQGCTSESKCFKRVRSTRCCCKHTHVCCRILKLRVSHKGQRLQRIARPPAAAGTHMCVAEQTNAELHRGSRFTKVWPTICCWGHTHVCCRTGEIRVAPKGQRLQRFGRAVVVVSTHTHVCHCAQHSRVTNVSPTKRCREHTHTCVCCRNQGCTQGPKFYQGVADQLLLRAYTRVLQNASLESCTQRSSSPDQLLLRACTCVFQNKSNQGAANGRNVTRSQGFSRKGTAASIRMCAAE